MGMEGGKRSVELVREVASLSGEKGGVERRRWTGHLRGQRRGERVEEGMKRGKEKR